MTDVSILPQPQSRTLNLPKAACKSIRLSAHAQVSGCREDRGRNNSYAESDEISEVAASLAQQYLAVTARSSFEIDARFAYQGDVWSSVEDMQRVYNTKYLRYNDKPVVRQLFIDEEKTGCCSATPCGRCARIGV